jgi:hypothetical protein
MSQSLGHVAILARDYDEALDLYARARSASSGARQSSKMIKITPR